MTIQKKDILTPYDLQRELGIGRSLTYELLNSKQIKAVKVGGKLWRIHRTELERFLKDGPAKREA